MSDVAKAHRVQVAEPPLVTLWMVTTTYTYDNNGNVIQIGTTTFYTYDYANRLTQSSIKNGTAASTLQSPTHMVLLATASRRPPHLPPSSIPTNFTRSLHLPVLVRSTPPRPNTSTQVQMFFPRSTRNLSAALPPAPRSRDTFIRTTSARRM
jgi:hypothetical protein